MLHTIALTHDAIIRPDSPLSWLLHEFQQTPILAVMLGLGALIVLLPHPIADYIWLATVATAILNMLVEPLSWSSIAPLFVAAILGFFMVLRVTTERIQDLTTMLRQGFRQWLEHRRRTR